MGFFDLLKAKRSASAPSSPAPSSSSPQSDGALEPQAPAEVLARLAKGRACLEAKDLAGAMAIYEPLLAEVGERADVLVSISGELGMHGHVQEIVEYIAPRYDANRHGPATGINVIQAYLGLRNIEAAQHILDILFSLNRSELEDRLHGFSNAIAELIEARRRGEAGPVAPTGVEDKIPHINLVTISKPIWFYGLEPLAEQILPSKAKAGTRVAFAQLGILDVENLAEKMKQPEDKLGRLSRAIPLWLAETLFFCPHYQAVAALGVMQQKDEDIRYALFGIEWTPEHIQQLITTSKEPFDYVFTGSLREDADDIELVLRLWEIKKLRERKQLTVRWNAATADAELTKLHTDLRLFMEHTPYPAGQGIAYTPPQTPTAWIDTLGASVNLFLAEKGVISPAQVSHFEDDLKNVTDRANEGISASLACLTLGKRALGLRLLQNLPEMNLFQDPLVEQAKAL